MVARKVKKADRKDPKKNKSLAIRLTLDKMPQAKAADVAAAASKEYGHDVKPNMVYMVKTKANMVAAGGGHKKSKTKSGGTPMKTAALWVDAIKVARHLLKMTGSAENGAALLKALDKHE